MKTETSVGINFTLDVAGIRLAVIDKIMRDASKKGIDTPTIQNMIVNSVIHFFAADGSTVDLSKVFVAVNDQ